MISYDSVDALRRFAEAQHIGYPLLSDQGSAVIRKFGILNTNVPPDVTRFYGIPFPGDYLIAADGTVKEKLFLPDYQDRPAASLVLLNQFDTSVAGNTVTVTADDVQAKIVLSATQSYSGQQLGVAVEFEVAPGWHIYGEPLPEGYTPTSLKFDDQLVAAQTLNLPKPEMVKFEAIGETFPVYHGNFKASGSVRLKQNLAPGEHTLAATLSFQECNNELCKIPQSVRVEIPIRIDPMVPAAPKG